MANAIDVATYIYSLDPTIDRYKMHKLLYYVQGWSICRLNKPAFDDDIQAWERGPVVPSIYERYEDIWVERDAKSAQSRLNGEIKANVEAIVKFFRSYNGSELIDRTHRETPWAEAYNEGTGRNAEITHDALKDYFCDPKNFFAGDDSDKELEYVIMTQAGVLKRLEDM